MKDYYKTFSYIVGIATLVALFIAIWSLYVTIDSVYGNAKLKLEYAVGGDFNIPIKYFYWYDNQISFQFLIKNVGHGSTVYTVEPQLNCQDCNFIISYDGNEFKKIGKRPIDIHPISPKSSQFIMIRFENITQKEAGQEFDVLVRHLETNEHLWLKFWKQDQKITDFMFEVRGYD